LTEAPSGEQPKAALHGTPAADLPGPMAERTGEAMLKPLNDRVVIKKSKETLSPGGIHMPEGAGEKPGEGQVVAVGPGQYEMGLFVPTTVKAGDKVLFDRHVGHAIKLNGEELLVVNERDILGVLDFTATNV
jgi:chaperonin GroES